MYIRGQPLAVNVHQMAPAVCMYMQMTYWNHTAGGVITLREVSVYKARGFVLLRLGSWKHSELQFEFRHSELEPKP